MTPEDIAIEVLETFLDSDRGIEVPPGHSLALPLRQGRFLRGKKFRHVDRINWDEIEVTSQTGGKAVDFRIMENIIWNNGLTPIFVGPKRDGDGK